MKHFTYCKSCLFPNAKPDLYFDDRGICDACLSAKAKHGQADPVDWEARERQFLQLISDAKKSKGGVYDCVIPVSGGKDSTWQTYAAKVLHNLRPLAVTFDQFDSGELGRYDLEILRQIGVDHIHFTLNPKVVKDLVRKGFEIVGDHYWVIHVGMFTVPFRVALNFKIPLVIFGEQPQFEYGGPEKARSNYVMDRAWRQEFGLMRGLREEDMTDQNISLQDLDALTFPADEEMKNVLGTFYGHFFKWNASEHLKIVKGLGWRPWPKPPTGAWVDYENTDAPWLDIRERMKFLKYGYGRVTDQLNIAIRNGEITREEALLIAIERDGEVAEENIASFCDYLEISEDHYFEVMDSFVNQEIFKRTGPRNQWELKEQRK